jgi:hypothetical protein
MALQQDQKNSVFRDSVFPGGLVEVPEKVRHVIDTPIFQRLRGVRQLGLASYVFPGGEHSRFAHSIGVYGTATLAFSTLKNRANKLFLPLPGTRFDEVTEAEFTIAALCHDVGHTAFSHVLEGTLLPPPHRHHETLTAQLVQEDTKLSGALAAIADIPSIIQMLAGTHPNNALSQLVSGPFDVDRCDYLYRDSIMTGVDYGKHDLPWLIHSLAVRLNSLSLPVLVLDGPRGIDSLRQFLQARRDMHRHVYFHHTIRSAQLLLKSIFNRLQDVGSSSKILKTIPSTFHRLAKLKDVTIDDFMNTTDAEVLVMIRALSKEDSDKVLKFLCKNFIERKFPKCVLDSARHPEPLEKGINVDFTDPGSIGGIVKVEEKQPDMFLEPPKRPIRLDDLYAECRKFVRGKERMLGWPEGVSNYVVTGEKVPFSAGNIGEFGFIFNDKVWALNDIDKDSAVYNLRGASEDFSLFRLYAPPEVSKDLKTYLMDRYRISGSESGSAR